MKKCTKKEIVEKELKACWEFFQEEGNWEENSKGYGLIKDKTTEAVASIASVGYGLAGLIIGVEHGWMEKKRAYYIAEKTLDTFLENVEGKNGFFYHFIDMKEAKRVWNSELSIIDTGIFICGAITAGEYFGGKVKRKAEKLYQNINWKWYTDEEKNQFYMGYRPEDGFSRTLGYVCGTINVVHTRSSFSNISCFKEII